MLSDQWSPYVGRLACDWHRLPGGPLPGNHRPRRKHSRIIATSRERPSERPGRGDQGHLPCPRRLQGTGAGSRGGSTGQHVVHQQHTRKRMGAGPKRVGQGPPPVGPRSPGLRIRLPDPLQQRADRQAGDRPDRLGEGLGLVESTDPSAPGSQRYPRHCPAGSGRWRPFQGSVIRRLLSHHLELSDHGRSEGVHVRAKPPELEPQKPGPDRSRVEERGPTPRHFRWRTVRTAVHLLLQRSPAPVAPRRPERGGMPTACSAERPVSCPAAHAPPGEHRLEEGPHHSCRPHAGQGIRHRRHAVPRPRPP
jgi:hypothetical protein